jgi:hypothetical protein
MFRNFIVLFVVLLFVFSCNHAQSQLDNASSEIEYAEKNKKNLSDKELADLKIMMEALESDFELNRDKYDDEQIKEYGRIQGRYTSLIVNKGLADFQETVKDLGKQMEGFIEGVNSDTLKNK